MLFCRLNFWESASRVCRIAKEMDLTRVTLAAGVDVCWSVILAAGELSCKDSILTRSGECGTVREDDWVKS